MDHVLFYFLSQQDKEENKIYTEVDLRKKLIILALHRKYCGDESAPSLDGEAASSFSFDTFDRWRGENLQFTADRSDEDDVSELTLLEDERINDAGPLENSEAAPPMCKPHSLPDLHVFDKKDEVDGQQDDKEDISE
ncbi:MAG: hypothetical protein LBL32_03140 [Holosporales bacterium]|jgi:hypothetical protein|nr:hypothetical protein [Holosporales bacterium]